ncbi:MAG: hypothetical protein CMN64_08185 [Sphingobium sp.]|nr:hypothetical protein [Sphingobium sp.]MBS87844.1 hypothetical protein [Sphingobium sp.]
MGALAASGHLLTALSTGFVIHLLRIASERPEVHVVQAGVDGEMLPQIFAGVVEPNMLALSVKHCPPP